ncbi:MAG TPA: hypothetical protein PK788_13255, partial [Gemmatimonadaceae bacterium]|nr:hypothetical protein [Gemmatimonadaceae bacterium]
MRRFALSSALLALTVAGCDKTDAAPAAAGATPSATPTPAAPRAAGSVVLSGNDVHTLAPGRIEVGIAISGGLRPIETMIVRARLEGDVVEVALPLESDDLRLDLRVVEAAIPQV